MQAIGNVIVDRKGIEKCAFLKHHADLFAHRHHLRFVVVSDVFTVDKNSPGVGFKQAQYQFDDRRLSAARTAENDLQSHPS